MYYQKSHRIYPIIYKNRFYNYEGESRPEFLLHTLKMLCQSKYYRYKNSSTVDALQWYQANAVSSRRESLTITWVGHSTFLIQVAGINILTDPIFGNASFLYPRIMPPGIASNSLPPIDFVLLSHNHRDHMDASSLYNIKSQYGTTFLVPQGDKKWFRRRGFESVIEHMWWDKKIYVSPYDGVTRIEFMFVPAYHWSQRGVFDYNKSLWGGWVIKAQNFVLFFGGDTAYSPHFKAIQQEFSKIDYAILPISPCNPRVNMVASHLDAEDAGQAFLDLKAQHFIPMHWGTFYFGLDEFLTPVERLNRWWQLQKFSQDYKLHIMKIGQSLDKEDLYNAKQEEPFVQQAPQLYL